MRALALSAAWTLGVYLGVGSLLPLPSIALFFVAALGLTLLLGRIGLPLLVGVCMLLLLMGLYRGQEGSTMEAEAPLTAYLNAGEITLRGLITRDPEALSSATRFRLEVEAVRQGEEWAEASGAVLVTARESADLVRRRDEPYFRYGDRLLLTGRLEKPPELEDIPDFDYSAYLARRGISSVMAFPQPTLIEEGEGMAFYQWLYSARRSLADSIEAAVSEPQAATVEAMLLGLRRGIPEDLKESFSATGTSHVLAISGLHVGVLMGIALLLGESLLGRRRRLYLLLPLVLVWQYALISGMSPSVARAAIMATVYLSGTYLGRPGSVYAGLGVAAAVMVGLNPDVLWEVSFQLSFAAVAGIALLAPLLRQWLRGGLEG